MSEQTRADLLADMAIEQLERAERVEAENVHLLARVARLETALREIAEGRCEHSTSGNCQSNGRKRRTTHSADRWCDTCIAAAALTDEETPHAE